ncbi:hypothetical protein MNBD_GAMMA01-1539 [hydrothermal vent metagenome]|uniref:histidine kinase n=1 Tax=hydrothermal vent metagenome TaxID=652676 RepID=A0A3B0UXT8_9ZZZZ
MHKIIVLFVKIIFLFISFFLFSHPSFCLPNLSTKDGLPSNVIKKIAQDTQGFMWFATSKGLTRYDGYNFSEYELPDSGGKFMDVTTVSIYKDTSLLIGTKNNGLYIYQSDKIHNLFLSDDSIWVRSTIVDSENNIWVGTDYGLFRIDKQKRESVNIEYFKDKSILSLIFDNNGEILVSTSSAVYHLEKSTGLIRELPVISATVNNNTVMYRDYNKNIWLGTRNGLYKFFDNCECFEIFDNRLKDLLVYSMISNSKRLWIGTLYDGLYMYSYESGNLIKYHSDSDSRYQLSDNSIVSLFIDKNDTLWIGTFREGVNLLNLVSLYFAGKNNQRHCDESHLIYGFFEQNPDILWLATEQGLLQIDNTSQECSFFTQSADNKTSASNIIRSILIDSQDNFWVGTTEGLNKFNPETGQFNQLSNTILSSTFIIEYKKNILLLGNATGLYKYDIQNNRVIGIKTVSAKLSNTKFQNYFKDNYDQYFFATDKGIFRLTDNMELEPILIDSNLASKNIIVTAVQGNKSGDLWFGVNNKYFMHMDSHGTTTNITERLTQGDIDIRAILSTNNDLWISTSNGLFKYNTLSERAVHYNYTDGLHGDEFFHTSNYRSPSGKLYFGGKKGFDAFFPEDISKKTQEPNIAITNIKLMGNQLGIGDKTHADFLINEEISNLKNLVLNHNDNKIDIEFAALDYADSRKNKYAFRLIGLNNNWEYTDTKNRRAVYTNLRAGEYVFQVKGANKYGIWSTTPKELKIIVYPAPWFSPWAYAAYVLIAMLSIWGIIRYKTMASRKRAIELEKTVAQRTVEVNRQKKMVESLLEHKNAVFANVTHEFNTPLALILGPAEQLANNANLIQHTDELTMIQRNAKRLMLMVGQILKLSQAESDKEVIRQSQALQPTLLMLHESFQSLANDKNIKLTLTNNYDVNVYATAECLEVVIGNLLSNAIKYTNDGGEISIKSQLLDQQISISITDSGSGIEAKNLDRIFKRFTRLDNHKNIAGTGIGLSVVKEITEANDGHVHVTSQWGRGSTFRVTFPTTAIKADEEMSQVMVDQLVSNTESEVFIKQPAALAKQLKNRVTVLIIEDNLDMQAHIGKVLSNRFNCLFADRGRTGIGLALQQLPDIVICDVMMPGMDGYQVTRILRHDSRTSHIPIVLLTALNTTQSRIKGWRENIDIYITKPFNATELNVQLDNILTIRKLLQKETNRAIHSNSSLNSLGLSQQDLKFVEKFKDVIGKYYGNEYFQKADLAAKMAVSERQLHRKLRALTGETPMEMLRDYRLEKAAVKLRTGYQVGIVSDECGFGSVSYFGSCFKKKYGVTAKKYQSLK